MEITGIVKAIGEAVQVSEKFKKLEFVLTDNSTQYPQHISFQLTQDKCSLIEKYSVGAEIKVHFNLRGREWTSPKGEVKYFNTIEAWRIEGPANQSATTSTAKAATPPPAASTAQEDDDLPF